ncbi:hypothetical protein B1T45_19965, partial [Mycobacterium kansasii]
LINGQPVTAGTGTGTGGTGTGGTGTGGTGTGGPTSGQYSPYVDITLYPGPNGYDFSSAARAGVKNATLAFITADPNGQAAWGGYSALDVTGGSQSSFINNQIANMHSAGINATISFGGAALLALTQSQRFGGAERSDLSRPRSLRANDFNAG